MKSGVRALGIAESYREERSVLAGAVLTAAGRVDGVAFETCTVGGLDATDAIRALYEGLDREDVRYLLVSGIAPAWFNVLDLRALHAVTERPVLSVSFEESPGLEAPLREAFEGEALTRRLERYRDQPPRDQVVLNGEDRFVRSVGCEEPVEQIVSHFTPEGGRPEPIRVARLAARGADRLLEAESGP